MPAPADFRSKINGLVAPDLLRVMLLEMGNIANPPGGELELSEYLRECFAGIGLQAEPENGACHLRIILRGEGGGPVLVLNGPLSSSVNSNTAGAGKRSGLFDGEWIYGNGVADMKCAFVVYFGAVKAIRQADLQLRGDIIINGLSAGASSPPAADAAVTAAPTGLRIRRSRALIASHPLLLAFKEAHRTVFFGREPSAFESLTQTPLFNGNDLALAYGPGGIDREGGFNVRDRELGEIVSVPNLVMCTKVFALAAADICGSDRSLWLAS